MFRTRHKPASLRLKFLAGLAALGLVACLALAFRLGAGTIQRSPVGVLLLLALAIALLSVLLRLLARMAAWREQPDLSASELSTLTFPPEPRAQRQQLQRAK